MTTQITNAGIEAATNARNNQGPKINITSFKIGSSVTPPTGNETDIVGDLVYVGYPSQLQYKIANNNTCEFIVTLDESIGPFYIGRIGLFMDNGDGTSTLFSITSIDAVSPDYKFPTTSNTVGNRLAYNIYLALSDLVSIAKFTVQLLQQLTIPEVQSELDLPDPNQVAYDTYQVMKHSFMRASAIGYRETAVQGRTNSAWLMSSERLIPGQGEGIIPIASSFFDVLATIGTVVGLDYTNRKIIVGEPSTNNNILGIRSSDGEITNYGIYVDPVNTYSPMQRLFVGTGAYAGTLTVVANNWPIGYAMGPVNTQNAAGYLCWIDFTRGAGGGGTGVPGPPGPSGAPGPPGSGSGSGTGFPVVGQCYLQLIGSSLVLTPYNGNNIFINSVPQTIPAGGISLLPAGLLPNTLYYIYVFMNNGTMTLEASTASYVTSTIDGVQIKSADQSRTLVGIAQTITGPAWVDTDGQLYVLSWFNKRMKKSITTIPATITTQNTSWSELSTAVRNYFLVWSSTLVRFSIGGYHGSQGGNSAATAPAFDGLQPELVSSTQGTSGTESFDGIGINGTKIGLIEGGHYGTILGFFTVGTGAGKAIWPNFIPGGSNTVTGPLYPAPVSMTVIVDG
jgi:hypothetical protein